MTFSPSPLALTMISLTAFCNSLALDFPAIRAPVESTSQPWELRKVHMSSMWRWGFQGSWGLFGVISCFGSA